MFYYQIIIIRLLTILTSIVDHIKGKIKDIGKHLNKLIKEQLQIHHGNTEKDKPYKSRPSRAKFPKSEFADMNYDDDDLPFDNPEIDPNEMLTKKRLRPRKNKVNYLEMEQGAK